MEPKSRVNKIRVELTKAKVVIGTVTNFAEPATVEMIGAAGFDFLVVYLEHHSIGLVRLENLIRAAEVSGMTPVVQLPEINESYALRALEAGAMGLIFPHVKTREDAVRCVRATKYPPRGVRGMHPSSRATRFGEATFAQHVREANEQTQVWAIIEDVEGVKNIEEIVHVDGLDVIMPGPGDLSVDLGVPGEWTHPSVIEHLERITTAALRVLGLHVAPFIRDSSEAERWVNAGCRMLLFSHDSHLFPNVYRSCVSRVRPLANTGEVGGGG
jgi:2-keto-3-deoxy-L-rhamnonate aldolase RhmA